MDICAHLPEKPPLLTSSLLMSLSYVLTHYDAFLLAMPSSLQITAPVECLSMLKERMICQASVQAQDHPIKR